MNHSPAERLHTNREMSNTIVVKDIEVELDYGLSVIVRDVTYTPGKPAKYTADPYYSEPPEPPEIDWESEELYLCGVQLHADDMWKLQYAIGTAFGENIRHEIMAQINNK